MTAPKKKRVRHRDATAITKMNVVRRPVLGQFYSIDQKYDSIEAWEDPDEHYIAFYGPNTELVESKDYMFERQVLLKNIPVGSVIYYVEPVTIRGVEFHKIGFEDTFGFVSKEWAYFREITY